MFTIGIDFGTNSVRALVVRVEDGAEFGSCVVDYPSGEQGILLDPRDHQLARQHPGDYLVGMEESVRGALVQATSREGFDIDAVAGVGVDSTGSSPMPVDVGNASLSADPRIAADPNAQCWLWKDHTSWREALAITEKTTELRPRYIARCGGVYSSEWWWAKIWHCLDVVEERARLVPYQLWDNREPGKMLVWVRSSTPVVSDRR